MNDRVTRFYNSIVDAAEQSQSGLVELFIYYLNVEACHDREIPKRVTDCFLACNLAAPNVPARLPEGLKTRPPN